MNIFSPINRMINSGSVWTSLFYQLIVFVALSLLAGCERYALDRQMEAIR